MASTRSSVRRRSITSFLQSRKPKESESPITSQKKPPDRNGKPPATAMLPPSRTASQPTPAPPVPTIPNQAEYSASQPTPHTSSWANEVQANDSEPSPMDTPPSQEEVEKAGDTDIDSQDKKVNDAWNWLVDKKLLNDVDAITSDDILTTLYKIASNTTFTKEIIRKSVEAATFMLEIAIRNERQQELPREEDNVEEGEIRGEKDNNSAALKAIEEMKVTLQDTIIRATTALEEATKELKESKTIVNNQSRATNTQPITPNPPAIPYSDIARNVPNDPPRVPRPEARAIERAKSQARQLVFDLNGEHRLQKLSNISIRDEIRQALRKANAPPHVDVFLVRKLSNGGILLELNSAETGEWLRDPKNSEEFRKHAGIEVDFTPRSFNILAKFMPIELFDPDNEEHVKELREENCWDKSMLLKAKWVKAIEKRNPGQTHAHLLLTFADGSETNTLLLGRGFISYHGLRINVDKDKRIPMRCAKCQMYGHQAKDCSKETVCGRCGQPGHESRTCNSDNLRCVNCKEDGHEAYSSKCPTFQRKLQEYNTRTPENTLPYYPHPVPDINTQQTQSSEQTPTSRT